MSTRRSSRAPIWTQPAPGSRAPRFSREQIADVALRIADTEGFDAVSMRRIADELGAGTMTLYHYVRTKDDLIALMDDAIMASVVLPEGALPAEWRPALTAIAMSSYRAFMRHPWALDALRGAHGGPNGMRHMEQSLAALANAPFDLRGKLDALAIVDDYVFGHVHRVVEAAVQRDAPGGKPSAATVSFVEALLATGEFPHVAELFRPDAATGWARIMKFMNDEERFTRGIEALLDGLELRAARAERADRAQRPTPADRAERAKPAARAKSAKHRRGG